MKLVIKSLESTVFGSGQTLVDGYILHLAEPIPKLISSLKSWVPNDEPQNEAIIPDFTSTSVPIEIFNVTEVNVTHDVYHGDTVEWNDDNGVLTIDVLYLDVSKPSRVNEVRPSRVWIVEKPFAETILSYQERQITKFLDNINKELNK